MTDCLLDAECLSQLADYRTLFVGYSGGLDSTVLLHYLANRPDLIGKVSAVHIHHGLSSNADAWRDHCQVFCTRLSIPFITHQVNVDRSANIEAAARLARYDVFERLLGEHDALLLAHHADDQAETLLLQLFRGAGIDGMAAMPTVKSLGLGKLLRPFLQHSRKTLEAYADIHQLSWVDDASNQDTAFSRNYLRHQVMPLLRARWPSVVSNLARSARHCQQAKLNLQALADLDLQATGQRNTIEKERVSNILRTWLQKNQVRMPSTNTFNRLITELIFAKKDANPCVAWEGMCVRRYQNTLYLLKTDVVSKPLSAVWLTFPADLPLNDYRLKASSINAGLQVPLGSRVEVRFREGGEVFHWHGQRKTLKNLFQEWRVPPWQRDTLPLIYIDGELAAVAGFAISDRHYGMGSAHGYHIEIDGSLQQEDACLSL